MVELLDRPVVCKLATVDADGYPHITPLWFHWDGDVIRMTSLHRKPHLRRLRLDTRACALIEEEQNERADGERDRTPTTIGCRRGERLTTQAP